MALESDGGPESLQPGRSLPQEEARSLQQWELEAKLHGEVLARLDDLEKAHSTQVKELEAKWLAHAADRDEALWCRH